MKILHLICNAHLDPVWMWDWHEGAATALATFYSAAELAEEYDYIFCHNEVLLYQYVEQYDPRLFERIKTLIQKGKWHIMGGWYVQPDCNLPAGESFIRQITLGREYFKEKFEKKPSVAVNFDSFGHTRGLVQILQKCGFDGYICCRPMPEMMELPNTPFWWKGYDGSFVKTVRIADSNIYCSKLGQAKTEILRKGQAFKDQKAGLALWGVGNHGGGPSRKDLSDIVCLMAEKEGEYEIIHSTPEAYFSQVEPSVTVEHPLPCFIKSYSSISRIKQSYAQLEDLLYKTERACALAKLSGRYNCNREAFITAEQMMSAVAFHDVLSGTCTQEGEKSSIRKLEYAGEILWQEFLNAFFALAADYKQALPDDNPFIIFNYQPYEYTTVVETEILIPEPLISDEKCYRLIAHQDGTEIASQVIKENSNINYDRRKRLAYKCRLNPLGTTRVDVRYEIVDKQSKMIDDGGDILLTDSIKSVRIDRTTGLMNSFFYRGKEYLSEGAFVPIMFDDNQDPWGWNMSVLGSREEEFQLSTCTQGVFEGLKSVTVTEKGDVLTQVECQFEKNTSCLTLCYKIYRDLPYVDVSVKVLWNEQSKGLKLKIPTTETGTYFGQVAYGTEEYEPDGKENIAQRFVSVGEEDCLSVYSSGVYGNSKKGKDLYLTLLNGSVYCAHPIEDRPLVDDGRLVSYIEQGEHDFCFRIGVNKRNECERISQEFSYMPHSVNMYPHGEGNIVKGMVQIEDCNIVLTAMKKRKCGGFILRFFNNSATACSTVVKIGQYEQKITLEALAFQTYLFDGNSISESMSSDVY